jgi:hypothetical protein
MNLNYLMNKFIIFFILIVGLSACFGGEKEKVAKKLADKLLDDIGNGTATDDFPEQYFPHEKLVVPLQHFTEDCDFKNRKGGLVKTSISTDPPYNTSTARYTYQFDLKCRTLRLILNYSLGDTVQLTNFQVQTDWVK